MGLPGTGDRGRGRGWREWPLQGREEKPILTRRVPAAVPTGTDGFPGGLQVTVPDGALDVARAALGTVVGEPRAQPCCLSENT